MVERELSLVQTSAGGGTRARPVSLYSATTSIPKGLMRVMGLPLAEIQLRQAREFGIENSYIVAKDLENREQMISKFEDGSKLGLKLHYSHPEDDEDNNGSGDAILTNIETYDLAGDSLILANDNIYEIDIEKALERHYTSNALITILTTPMMPILTMQQYGLVNVGERGRVVDLLEKPDNEDEIMGPLGYMNRRDLIDKRVHVNTGGYIVSNNLLAKVAEKEPWIKNERKTHPNFDMAGVLLRGLVAKGYPIYASSIDEWGDIGTLPNYLETVHRALGGAFPSIQEILRSQEYESRDGNIWIHNETLDKQSKAQEKTLRQRIEEGIVELHPKTFIGKDVRIEDKVSIRSSDIEDSTKIGEGSDIDSSLINDCSLIGPYTVLDRSILSKGVRIHSSKENKTEIRDGSVIGPQVQVSGGSRLRDVIIYPGYLFNQGPEIRRGEVLEPSQESLMKLVKEYGRPD